MGQASQLPNRNRAGAEQSRLETSGLQTKKLDMLGRRGAPEGNARSGTKVMQCFFCHAWNDEDVPRCVRCGRRVPPPAGKSSYPFMAAMSGTATAAQLDLDPRPDNPPPMGSAEPLQATLQPELPIMEGPPANGAGTQPWLFRAGDLGRPKVVPIPVLTPRLDPIPRKPRAPRDQAQRRTRKTDSRQTELQHLLDLQEALPEEKPAGLDGVIDCDAVVAPTAQRVAAAMVDGGMIAAAVAVFVSMFYFAGGTLGLDKQSVLLLFSATMLFALLYRALWCLGGGDTPGTRSAGMRVVNFDGRSPDRSQRGRRLAAGLLSVLSVGLGLIWILVDEENLSWHDHISKTFPTPV